jgi:REP element-mobilizing transposase RayT
MSITALISWTCYGQWLHGNQRGSVDPEHNVLHEPWLAPDPERQDAEGEAMTQHPYELDEPRRRVVLDAIREVCKHRGWILHAVHVRALHVHVVVSGEATPERMMNDFKAYASWALNRAGFDDRSRKRWTRHGSTRYINDPSYLHGAVNYVLNKQGTPMQRWPEDEDPTSPSR